MKLRDLLHEMTNSLFSSKLRTALTMLGLIIGIVSVIVMLAAVQGVQNMVLDQMGGARASVVSFGVWDPNEEIRIGKKYPRVQNDIDYLMRRIPTIQKIGLNAYIQNLKLEHKDKSQEVWPLVLDEITSEFSSFGQPGQGRLITPKEYRTGAPVIVLGYEDAKQLFKDPDEAVGQRVSTFGVQLEVVGIFPQGGMMGGGQSIIARNTVERRLPKAILGFSSFEVVFEGEEQAKEGAQLLKDIYIEKYPHLKVDENIWTFAYAEMLNEVRQFTQVFSILALLIASTSLTVGGIGIMNMMLTNVTERTREIGLRKAIGAKASSITWQFLFEAIAVCLAGNAVAVIISYAFVLAAKAIVPLVSSEMQGFNPVITWWSLLISVGVSTFIAIVFGWYPARRASKLDPIEALRFQ